MKFSTRAVITLVLVLSGLTSVVSAGAATGIATAVFKGNSTGLDADTAMASNGKVVWVANSAGNSVTEIHAKTGKTVKLKNAKFGFKGPNQLSDDGTDLWVVNAGGNSSHRTQRHDGRARTNHQGFVVQIPRHGAPHLQRH